MIRQSLICSEASATMINPPFIGSEAPRRSSLKHRMLNRLASGLLPPTFGEPPGLLPSSSTVVSEPPTLLASKGQHISEALPSLESKRQHITEALLSVHQADIDTNNSMFLAIDVKCAFGEVGALPMDVAIVIDNS